MTKKTKQKISNRDLKSLPDSVLENYKQVKGRALNYFADFQFKKSKNSTLTALAGLSLVLSVSLVYFSLNLNSGSVLGEFSTSQTNLGNSSLSLSTSGGFKPCQPVVLNFQDPEIDLKSESSLVVNLKSLERKSLTTIFSQTDKPLDNVEVIIPCEKDVGEYELQVNIIQQKESQQNYISWRSGKVFINDNE